MSPPPGMPPARDAAGDAHGMASAAARMPPQAALSDRNPAPGMPPVRHAGYSGILERSGRAGVALLECQPRHSGDAGMAQGGMVGRPPGQGRNHGVLAGGTQGAAMAWLFPAARSAASSSLKVQSVIARIRL